MRMPAVLYAVPLLVLAIGAAAAEPAELAVVRSWDELQAQPAIALADGVRVRLGIDRDGAVAGGMILAYCLAEGFRHPATNSEPQRLGPVVAELKADGLEAPQERLMEQLQLAEERDDGRPQLYLRPLYTDARSRRVDVRTTDGAVVARRVVTVAGAEAHPWATCWTPGDGPPAQRNAGADGLDALHVDPRRAEVALPRWHGLRRVAVGAGTGPLPTLLPADVDRRLRVQMQGVAVEIDLGDACRLDWPELQLLARWWVDGVAVVPRPDRPLPTRATGGRGAQARRIRIAVDWAALGATAGSRIAAQVLVCPEGVESLERRLFLASRNGGDIPVLLSPRLDGMLP